MAGIFARLFVRGEEIARMHLAGDEMPTAIAFGFNGENGKWTFITVYGGADEIKIVRRAIEMLKPVWIMVITTPLYRGKHCLYIEVKANGRRESRLYDIIHDGRDYNFEVIEEGVTIT